MTLGKTAVGRIEEASLAGIVSAAAISHAADSPGVATSPLTRQSSITRTFRLINITNDGPRSVSSFLSTARSRSRSIISRFSRFLQILLLLPFFLSTSEQQNVAENGLLQVGNGSKCALLLSDVLAPYLTSRRYLLEHGTTAIWRMHRKKFSLIQNRGPMADTK